MIALRLQYLPGSFHTTAWTSPRKGEIEWPPDPWRILVTLADTWRRIGAADSAAFVSLLGQIADPPEFLLPLTTANHTHHFRVAGSGAGPALREAMDSALALINLPRPQRVSAYIVWPNASFAPSERMLLDRICAQVRGLYDSPAACALQSVEAVPFNDTLRARVSPRSFDSLGPVVRRRVPSAMLRGESLLAALLWTSSRPGFPENQQAQIRDIEYTLPRTFLLPEEQYWRRDRSRSTIGSVYLRYRVGASRLGMRPKLRDAVAIAECFRSASIERYSRMTGEPATLRLAGKARDGSPSEGHDHPYFLPLASGDSGDIDAIAVWFPKGCTHEEYRAVASLTHLYERRLYHDNFPLKFVGADHLTTGTCWESATPVVLDRFPKVRGPAQAKRVVDAPAEQIAAMAERLTGRCPQVTVWPSARGIPLAPGMHLRPDAFGRTRSKKNTPPYPVVAATLQFEEPVSGPLVLGRLAHFGLGRFEPVGRGKRYLSHANE
ncbi:MAG: type I-G CRISPR-associated protein Csb2 [Candidatus Baltobacteraceae bacterium]